VLAFPTYAPSGYIVYQRGLPLSKGIWALPFDAASLVATGEPFVVAAHGAFPSVARDGTLLYLRITGESRQQLAWVDRDGRLGEAIGQPQEWIAVPHLSPDGSRPAELAGREWPEGRIRVTITACLPDEGAAGREERADLGHERPLR
jgi:hypothetical protein